MASTRIFKQWMVSTLFACAVLACALPDLKPFADATAQLHTSMVATNANVQLGLSEAGAGELAEAFRKELAVRIAAMEAVVVYTDALANISAAGQNGGGGAENLANSLNGFLGAISAPTMPSNYVAIAQSLFGIVATVRAENSLAQATEKADPAIQSIATTMTEDFHALENVLRVSGRQIKTNLLLETSNNDIAGYRMALEKQRRQLETAMTMDRFDSAQVDQLREINTLIEMTRDRYEPLMAKVKAIEDRTALQVRIVQNLRNGLEQWAGIHNSLAENLKRGLPPNVRLILATAIEIRELIKEENSK